MTRRGVPLRALVSLFAVQVLGFSLTGFAQVSSRGLARGRSPQSEPAQVLRSNTPTIIDVRRSMPLDPNEPVFHDFYINAGPEAGFKKGMYLTVIRPMQIQDPILNKQQGTLKVTVGYLKVLQVDSGITVARLHGELTDEERPALDYESVMIGDQIDPNSGTMSAPKVRAKAAAKAKPISVAAAQAKADAREASSSSSDPKIDASSKAPAVANQAAIPSAPKNDAPPTPVTNVKLEAGPAAPEPASAPSTVPSDAPAEKASPPEAATDMVRIPAWS